VVDLEARELRRVVALGADGSPTQIPADHLVLPEDEQGNLMPVLGSGHPLADIFLLKYEPRPFQKLSAERVFDPSEVVREPFVDGIVVQQDVSATVGAHVDARCVHEVSQRLARDGDPHEQHGGDGAEDDLGQYRLLD
jgi:hypothetical protein